jgi:integrase
MRGCSAAALRQHLSALSAFLKAGIVLGYAATNPVDRLERPPARCRLMPVPNDGQLPRLLAVTHRPMARTMLLTLATTGIRRAELVGIRIEDVDLERRRVRIRGKGAKEREAIISNELRHELAAYLYAKDAPPTAPSSPTAGAAGSTIPLSSAGSAGGFARPGWRARVSPSTRYDATRRPAGSNTGSVCQRSSSSWPRVARHDEPVPPRGYGPGSGACSEPPADRP